MVPEHGFCLPRRSSPLQLESTRTGEEVFRIGILRVCLQCLDHADVSFSTGMYFGGISLEWDWLSSM
eukprot:s292_g4.t1